MNYQKIYDNLIYHRKQNLLSKDCCYCENHHIIPRCIGGNDEKDNLIALTAREHYIAHLLLRRIYKQHSSLSAAVIMMQCKNNSSLRNFKYNSKLYEKERLYYAQSIKGNRHWTNGKIQIINKITLKKKWIKNAEIKNYPYPWILLHVYYFNYISKIYNDYYKLSFNELQEKYKFNWNDHYLKSLFKCYIKEYNTVITVKKIFGKTIFQSFLNNANFDKNLANLQQTILQLYKYIFDIYKEYKNPKATKTSIYKKYGFEFNSIIIQYLKKNIPEFRYNNTISTSKNNLDYIKQMYEYCKQYGYRQTLEYYKNIYKNSLTYTALWKLFKRHIPNFNSSELSRRSGRICIYKNNKQLHVLKIELQKYLDNGWQIGGTKSKIKNTIAINKNNITKYISFNKLDFYLNNGWNKGSSSKSTKNYKWMTNNQQTILIKPQNFQEYLNKGYVFGISKKKSK